MFRDGMYRVAYFSVEQPEREEDAALAVVRDGKIMGSDPQGGVYISTGVLGIPNGAAQVALTAQIPPGGTLVTGFEAGADGASLAVSGLLDVNATAQRTTVTIGGQAVDIEVTYLGPLPS